jgi:hypothetical protein
MIHRLPRAIILAATGAAVLVFAACGGSDRGRASDRAVSDFVQRVNKVVRNDQAAWPEEIPDDVPPFDQGRIVSVVKGLTPNGTSWTLHLAGVEEGGFEAYRQELASSGWETENTVQQGGGRFTARVESFSLRLDYQGERGTLVVRLDTF